MITDMEKLEKRGSGNNALTVFEPLPSEASATSSPVVVHDFSARPWVQLHPRSSLVEPLLLGTEWLRFFHSLFLSPLSLAGGAELQRELAADRVTAPRIPRSLPPPEHWALRSLVHTATPEGYEIESDVGMYFADAYLLQPLAVPVDIVLRQEKCARFEPLQLAASTPRLKSIRSVCGACLPVDLARLARRAEFYAARPIVLLDARQQVTGDPITDEPLLQGLLRDAAVAADETLSRETGHEDLATYEQQQVGADVRRLKQPLVVEWNETKEQIHSRLDLYHLYALCANQGTSEAWSVWVRTASLWHHHWTLERTPTDAEPTPHTCWGLVHVSTGWQSMIHRSLWEARKETAAEFGRTLSLRLTPHTFHRLGHGAKRLVTNVSTPVLYAGVVPGDSGGGDDDVDDGEPLIVLDLCCEVPGATWLACALVALERATLLQWIRRSHAVAFAALQSVLQRQGGVLSDSLQPLCAHLEKTWLPRLAASATSVDGTTRGPNEASFWNRVSGPRFNQVLRQVLASEQLEPVAVLTQTIVQGY
jgi:hypothetical protein